MRTWVEELETALKKEEQIVRALLEQALLKTPALQVGNIAELSAIVNREQPLVLQLQSTREGQQRILSQNGVEGETLRAVIAQAPEKEEALSHLRETLRAAVLELQRVNTKNHAIAASRFAQYDQLVKSLQKPQTLYTNHGAASGRKSTGQAFIDQKI
ncbi:MAG: flagellar protein FlgN [Ethanoligenens sp.]|uniref:flagellar protein FlgN n=1 Tax=Ethanoligenens sp. TaxID=2099655 RepID=UPI0039E81566